MFDFTHKYYTELLEYLKVLDTNLEFKSRTLSSLEHFYTLQLSLASQKVDEFKLEYESHLKIYESVIHKIKQDNKDFKQEEKEILDQINIAVTYIEKLIQRIFFQRKRSKIISVKQLLNKYEKESLIRILKLNTNLEEEKYIINQKYTQDKLNAYQEYKRMSLLFSNKKDELEILQTEIGNYLKSVTFSDLVLSDNQDGLKLIFEFLISKKNSLMVEGRSHNTIQKTSNRIESIKNRINGLNSSPEI